MRYAGFPPVYLFFWGGMHVDTHSYDLILDKQLYYLYNTVCKVYYSSDTVVNTERWDNGCI